MKVAASVLCVFLLGGNWAQSQARKAPHPKANSATASENSVFSTRLGSLEKQVSALTARVTFDEDLLNSKEDMHTTAMLDPAKLHVYQALDANPLQFLISLESVTPYLNGYKLVIDLGNPTTARFHGAKITCKWSKAYDWKNYSAESYKAWLSAVHTSQIDISNEIAPGSWNPVEIDLLPASQDELEYLTVSIQSNTLSLANN